MTAPSIALLAGPAAPGVLAALHQAASPGDAWAEESFARLLSMPGAFALAGPRGFVLARQAVDQAEILMLAVLPEARRLGLGRALLDAAVQHAAARGASALFLEVACGNAAARALYAGAGFAEVGRRRAYYPDGGDALVLRRGLAGALSRPCAG